MKKSLYILGFILLALSGTVNAQNLTSEGKYFGLGFMENGYPNDDNSPILNFYVTAEDTTYCSFKRSLGGGIHTSTFNVYPGTMRITIPLPDSIMAQESNTVKTNRELLFTSEKDKDVSIYAANRRGNSGAMSLVLPDESLGNAYYVMSHWESGGGFSEFLIVSRHDETEIRITPTADTENGRNAGRPFSIKLDEGEVYQVQAHGDLSGSKVETAVLSESGNCSYFALFAGNQSTQVGNCGNTNDQEHLFAQMYPIDSWGEEYIVIPYADRVGGDIVKVMALMNNTHVTINDDEFSLDQGGFFSVELDEVSVISANNPLSVAQISKSSSCDDQSGNPFLIMLSPNEQFIKNISYYAPDIDTVQEGPPTLNSPPKFQGITPTDTSQNYYLSIVTPTASINSMLLDQHPIGSSFNTVPGNASYSYTTLSTASGTHSLESSSGFLAYVYGYGDSKSIGFPAGKLKSNIKIRNEEGTRIPTDSVCLNEMAKFTSKNLGVYDSYTWDFGGGFPEIETNSNSINHQYAKTGQYTLIVTARRTCPRFEVAADTFFIQVINPQLEVKGPRYVCSESQGVFYWVEGNEYYENNWIIDGGTITKLTNDNILVNWGAANNMASIKLVSTNQYGCIGDTVTLPVRVNIPEPPFGVDSLCFPNTQGKEFEYNAYFVPDASYNWHIEKGTITEGQGTDKIKLNWTEPGIGKLWFDQTSPTNILCFGTSDTLIVHLLREATKTAYIITDKINYQRGESASISFETDPLFQSVNLYVNEMLEIDSFAVNEKLELTFDCAGTNDFRIEVFNSVDGCPNLATGETTITVVPPEMEIIKVTNELNQDSILSISWEINQGNPATKSFFLQRDMNNSWRTVHTIQSNSSEYVDFTARPFNTIEQYRVASPDLCFPLYETEIHNSVLLNVTQEGNEATFTWNGYEKWANGVETYEIYYSIDGEGWELFDNSNLLTFSISDTQEGFDYCFRVKALEKDGNLSESWSNQACASFLPLIHVYNVFTPDDDEVNDTFEIENIHFYPHSLLTIFDRSGTIIYEKKGYQNDWKGTQEGQLLSGVFYYSVQLNDPRAENDLFKGVVTIFR